MNELSKRQRKVIFFVSALGWLPFIALAAVLEENGYLTAAKWLGVGGGIWLIVIGFLALNMAYSISAQGQGRE